MSVSKPYETPLLMRSPGVWAYLKGTPMDSNLLEQVERRNESAKQEVFGLASGERRWIMRVPVDRERDSDCILIDALEDGDAMLPVVRASLALEAARAALLALDARIEPTLEWEERRDAAWDVWAKACRVHEDAVKAFR